MNFITVKTMIVMPSSATTMLFRANSSSSSEEFQTAIAAINDDTAIAMPKLRSGLRVSARTAKLMAYKTPSPNRPVKILAMTMSAKLSSRIVAI